MSVYYNGKKMLASVVIDGGGGAVEVTLQEKNITENGTYTADNGYTGLGKVNVNVPMPSGSIEITENGSHNVKGYETAVVNVASSGGSSDLVEVSELPSVVDESKIYRVNGYTDIEVYLILGEFNYTLKEIIKEQIGVDCSPEYSVVESLPSNPVVSDIAAFSIVHIYIMDDIPYLYANAGNGNMWLGLTDVFASMGATIPAKGFTADIHSETEAGIYTTYLRNPTAVPTKNAYIYNGANWVRTDRYRMIMLKEVEELTAEDFVGMRLIPRYFQYVQCLMNGGMHIGGAPNRILTKVTIPEWISSIGNMAFSNCVALQEVSLSEGLKGICENAFSDCDSLTSIEIPNSVATVESNAFYYCENLKRVDFSKHTSIPNLGSSVFDNTHSTLQIKVPAGLIDSWKSATNWANYAEKIVTDGVVEDDEEVSGGYSVGLNYCDEACEYGEGAELAGRGNCKDNDIIIQPTYEGLPVTEICYNAFEDDTNLRSVVIPSSVKVICPYAFSMCSKLESVTFEEEVEEIYDNVFFMSTKLHRVDFSNATEIPILGTKVFYDCSEDLQIKVPADLYADWRCETNWSDYADKIVTEFTN